MHIKSTEYGREIVYNSNQEYYRHQEKALQDFDRSLNNLDLIPDNRMNKIKKKLGAGKRRSFILDGYKKDLFNRQFVCAPHHTFYCVMCEEIVNKGDQLIIDTVCRKCEPKILKEKENKSNGK